MPWQWPVGAAFALALIATPAGVSGAALLLPVQLRVLGVIAWAVIRVEFLSGSRAFLVVAAGVLLPLGLWLTLGRQRVAPGRPAPSRRAAWLVCALALLVGTLGGIYGIGGGSLLAPILLLAGFSAYEVAPATLAATFLTSIAGIAAYVVLALVHPGSIGPDWVLGLFLGA